MSDMTDLTDLTVTDISPSQVFGVWEAPITNDADHIAAPVGAICVHCREPIQEGDNGRIATRWNWDGQELGGHIEHRECSLRHVLGGIGHQVDHQRYCRGRLGPDAGLSLRQSALLTWEYFNDTLMDPNETQIVSWRQRLSQTIATED